MPNMEKSLKHKENIFLCPYIGIYKSSTLYISQKIQLLNCNFSVATKKVFEHVESSLIFLIIASRRIRTNSEFIYNDVYSLQILKVQLYFNL